MLSLLNKIHKHHQISINGFGYLKKKTTIIIVTFKIIFENTKNTAKNVCKFIGNNCPKVNSLGFCDDIKNVNRSLRSELLNKYQGVA